MVDVMNLLKSNNLPLQPGTADIVSRYVGSVLYLSSFTLNTETLNTAKLRQLFHT